MLNTWTRDEIETAAYVSSPAKSERTSRPGDPAGGKPPTPSDDAHLDKDPSPECPRLLASLLIA
jgi:hypothetical protein